MWAALARAHQDQTTGGGVYWLRKVLLTKMEGKDILEHIHTMAQYHKQLSSLISPKNPLTANDVHVAALLSSIPQEWLHCVSSLMNQDGVKSEMVVSALNNKHTRCHSQITVEASVSSAKSKQSSTSNKSAPQHCYFCNVNRNDLNNCYNTKRVLNKLKASRKLQQESQRQRKPLSNQPKSQARAGRTTATPINPKTAEPPRDKEDSNYSGSEVEVAGMAVIHESMFSVTAQHDSNVDSECSISMTPHFSSVNNPQPDQTPVRLAGHSLVKSTYRGSVSLPFDSSYCIKLLVVPSLHKPLLSVPGICDLGLAVIFTAKGCNIQLTNQLQFCKPPIVSGNRKGNL